MNSKKKTALGTDGGRSNYSQQFQRSIKKASRLQILIMTIHINNRCFPV